MPPCNRRRRRRLPPPPPPNTPTNLSSLKHVPVRFTSGERFLPQQPQAMPAAFPLRDSTTNIPTDKVPSDHYVLKACTSAVDELTTLKSTINTLRMDYLALENELRQRMDEYVDAREEARKWKERCLAMERREEEIYTSRGLKAQNDRFVQRHGVQEKMGEVWRKKDSFVWLRKNEEEKGGSGRVSVKDCVERVKGELVGCKKRLQRRWGDWRQQLRE